MNYLAHLFLARYEEYLQVGSLMGDFVKGPIHHQESSPYYHGIKHHRGIDSFTDEHYKKEKIHDIFSAERRRYSGIILDIAFDHFLSKHWQAFAEDDIHDFSGKTYAVLDSHREEFPGRLRDIYPYMRDESWLTQYIELDGVARSIDRIGKYRLKRKNPLTGSVSEVEKNYELLDSYFLEFFPQLIAHSNSLLETS